MGLLNKKNSSTLKKVKGVTTRHLPERFKKSSKFSEIFADETLEQTEDVTHSKELQLEENNSELSTSTSEKKDSYPQTDITTDNNGNANESSLEHSDSDDEIIGTLEFDEETTETKTFYLDDDDETERHKALEELRDILKSDEQEVFEENDEDAFLTSPHKEKEERVNIKLPASHHDVEKSCDGVSIFPLKIDIYGNFTISEAEKDFALKIGRKSFITNKIGTLVECSVIKLENCFAIIKKSSDSQKIQLDWMMQRIDLLRKVKATDGRVYVDVLISDDSGTKQVRIPVTDFKENQVGNLMRYNISLFSRYALTMSIYFQKLLEKMPTEDASQKLGVAVDPLSKKYVFNAYKMEDGFTCESEYDEWDEYVQAFNELIGSSYPLQYLVAVSMSVPVLTLLQKKYNIDVHSYCVNVVGSSSTGKTISSRFCAALWTNPNSEKMFSAMLATGNAALKRLDGRYGIPTFLDEATVLGGISTTEYGYSVYEEREKRRLNSDCSEKTSGTWSTVVVMTSEQHFHSNAKIQNGGMAVRVHSMENLMFTTDKDHADALNDFIRRNWGLVGMNFTDMLFDGDFGELEELYENAKDKMREVIDNNTNSFTDRLINTYAITYMTAEMLESMGIDINVDEVAEIMASHNEMVGNEQNLALNAYRAVISYVTRNPIKFGIRKFMNETGQVFKLAIEESLMANILEKAGFTDFKVTIKELDKAGYLIRQQQGRLKSKLTIDDNLCYGYQIDLSELTEGVESVAEQVKKLADNDDEYLI